MRSTYVLWIAVAVLLALALAPAAGGHEVVTRNCGQIGFTPNSDDLASHIRATGLTCGLARDFVRDSKGRPRSGFRGFTCTRVVVNADLTYTRYRCTGAGDVIRWRRF